MYLVDRPISFNLALSDDKLSSGRRLMVTSVGIRSDSVTRVVQLLTELQVREKSVFLNLRLSCQRPSVDAGDDLNAKRDNPL